MNKFIGVYMEISVVIPNYNGNEFLERCLISLKESVKKEQTYNLRVILVDNGSTDNSIAIFNKYSNNKYSNNVNIKYDLIANSFNLGFSKAVNQGIKLAVDSESSYICLLNNDVEITFNFFNSLIKTIEKDSKIFSVSSKMLQYHKSDLIDDAGDEYTLLGWTKKSGNGLNKSITKYSKEREIFSSCAGAAIYRAAIFNEIGFFDENFFAYMEDVDIGYRALINGYKNVYSPNAIVYHVGSGSSGSKYNEFKIKLAARNNIWIVYKNMPWPQILINIGFLFIGFLIKYLFFLRKGYGKLYLEGLKEGLNDRKKIKRTKFKFSNLKNYFKIEWKLIVNTFKLLVK
jgi:GT2 family glycosyltransferase